MKRIALITYDISPYRGSESSVSWNFVTRMSEKVHITVYYGNHKDEVEKYLSQQPLKNVDWVNVAPKSTTRTGAAGLLQYISNYKKWHKQVYQAIREQATQGKIDLIHYLNPIGFKEPGYCWKIKEIPYVWGPIACVENRPLPLYKAYSLKGKYNAFARRIAHNALFLLMPRLKKALKNTDTVFAATPTGVRMLKKHYHRDAIYLPENGIPTMERMQPISYDGNQPLNIIWIGRVNDQDKALIILLDSLAKVKSANYHLHIVGPGILSDKMNDRINAMSGQTTFHGKIDRDHVQQLLLNSHLHVITSLGEATTTVLFEAMAKAVPTMTLDHCGMAGVVCDKCGIKIPISGYNKVTTRISTEIESLIEHPARINELSTGVLACSKRFMWDNRISLFTETYDRLINEYKSKR